ncbi:MAG: WXG100 family type VII secretion target [Eubacteriales bacterium]|nr:WXG100 family type VII secretion target [Eubacteriales bacterium]
MAAITIKVDPDRLDSAAGEFQNKSKTIHNLANEMIREVNQSRCMWQGEAGDAMRKRFNLIQTDVDQMYAKMQDDVGDLKKIARNYRRVENNSVSKINSLPTDVISN